LEGIHLYGLKQKYILIEQSISAEDYEEQFYAVLPALKDKRYIKVDGKPLFMKCFRRSLLFIQHGEI
jgi:hypothetical protein